jgi:hypothetical protein
MSDRKKKPVWRLFGKRSLGYDFADLAPWSFFESPGSSPGA